ncbi:MAG: hypothetical protein ACLFRT_00055 [Actinomycetota bacterium]
MTAIVSFVLVLAACGGDISDAVGAVDSGPADGEEAFESGSNASSDARATLTVGSDVHQWEANEWTTCTIGGGMPVWAHFQADETTQTGDWVQFIDRGDGGINFSAVLDGEEYAGTGSGEADEITSDGFVYSGTMGHDGEQVDVSLEVTC